MLLKISLKTMINLVFHLAYEVYFTGISTVFLFINQ